METIQIGMASLSEQAGGIPRFYYDLLRHLPQHAVVVRGLVTGLSRVSLDSTQEVREFAPLTTPLLVRFRALCRELRKMLAE